MRDMTDTQNLTDLEMIILADNPLAVRGPAVTAIESPASSSVPRDRRVAIALSRCASDVEWELRSSLLVTACSPPYCIRNRRTEST